MMVKTCEPSRLIAHQGYARRYPENSMLGIRAAIDAGARWIEVDVQMSDDGVLVLHHRHSWNGGGGDGLEPGPASRAFV